LINGLTDFLNSQPEDAGDPENPKAYLNWILLDEQFKLVPTGSGFIPVAGFSANLRTLAQSNTTMPKNGYLIVYVSNETERRDVFFDNIVVQHYPGPLVEETHYYPFGLTMAGISSKAAGSLENKRKWNKGSELESKEFSDGSGLELYSTFYRSLDPQLGRFWQIDPKPNYDESLYAAMGNNPIMNTDFLGDSIAPGRTKGMNFFVTANKALRKQDIADYRPTKGILKGVRAFFSSAYAVDNLKARVKSVLGLGAMKVVTAGNAKEATDKIINKLGDNGYVKNLTIDYHADNFGPDAPPGSPTTLSSSTAELSRLAGGYAGDATTCYLGNCWGGGNPNIGLTGQDDYTGMISGALDGATVYGNQAAASSISFALSSHFIGVVPLPYGKSPANRSAVGKHTVTGRDPTTGATTTRTTTNMVRIANSGAIEEDY
jgi:RHS repeat-associated protein